MGLLYCQKTGKAHHGTDCFRSDLHQHLFIACLLITGLVLMSCNVSYAQPVLLEKTISIPKQKTTLYSALNLISQKAECLFIYDSEIVDSDKKVKLYAENQPLNKVLDNILANPELGYKVIGKHILIYRTEKYAHPGGTFPPAVSVLDTIKNTVVKGHIYDNESKAAIPYASVGIVEQNLGTVTNCDGFFTLRIPANLAGTSLVVSHLGYMNQAIPLQLLAEQQVDLYLDRRVISIQEVIIRYIDPLAIIENAMEQRKVNYAREPVYLTSFYREGVKKNNNYISYSEAVFKIFKSPFEAGEHSDQVKLLRSRKIEEKNPGDTVFLKLKAGVQSALQLDLVKIVPGFLDLRPPVDYTYKYSDLVSYNDKDAYAVTFVQNADLEEALYKGTVYVEKEGFAILGADFEINPAYLDVAAADLVLKKSSGLVVKLEKTSYSVSYVQFNGRYYLNHVRCEIKVKTRLKHHLFSDNFSTFLEIATCFIDTADVVRFPKEETLKPNVVFSDQPFKGNDGFWGDFNVITPETKLSEALSKIIR